MTRTLAAAVLLLAVVPAGAAGDHELLAAQQELKIARDHLQAAGPDYQGHRRAAIEAIDQALKEIRSGLEVSRGAQGEKPARRSRPSDEPGAQPDDD
jgi:hypothetical protein